MKGCPERHGVFDRCAPEWGKSSRPVGRGVNRSQPASASVVGLGPPGGGRAQLTAGMGEGGQLFPVGHRSVASKQLVQGNAWREVFQDEEPGSRVGGNDARSEADPDIVAEEPERSQLSVQPP